MKKKVLVEIVCFLFVLLFIYAAVTKIIDYQNFSVQLGQSPLLTGFGEIIAWFIPSVEIVIAIMLTISKVRLLGLYASFSLMVMFTAYIIAILNFSFYVPCSCGGVLERMGWTEHLLFNIAFILLASLGIILHSQEEMVAEGDLVRQ